MTGLEWPSPDLAPENVLAGLPFIRLAAIRRRRRGGGPRIEASRRRRQAKESK